MEIHKYKARHKTIWDNFVRKSANGVFLHERDFMEYHSDRFEDHSLMFYKDDKLIACLPAHVYKANFSSHYGLTYAGFIIGAVLEYPQEIFNQLVEYCKKNKFQTIDIKLPPKFYDPNFENTLSHLERLNFQIIDHSTDLFVDLNKKWKPSSKKTAGYRNGKFALHKLVASRDFASFWENILIPQLRSRHQTDPVHTSHEIELLNGRYPEQIQHYDVVADVGNVAGMTVFNYGTIWKVQYAFGTDEGFTLKAMDFLYLEIIQLARDQSVSIIDLGTVNNSDETINEGLQRFKVELGALKTPVYTMRLNLQ